VIKIPFVEFGAITQTGFLRNIIIPINEIEKYRKIYNNKGIFATIYNYDSEDQEKANVVAPLYFDIDSDDLNKSKIETIKLVEYFINEGVKPEWIRIYFSGKKGFHLEIPFECFGSELCIDLNKIYRHIVKKLVENLKLKHVDTQIYDKRRLIRLPNSIHQDTGLFKIALTFDELKTKTIEEIKVMAKEPREIELFEAGTIDSWKGLFEIARDSVRSEESKYEQKIETVFIKDIKIMPCIDCLLKEGCCEGERNSTAFALVLFFKTKGLSKNEVFESLWNWNNKNNPPLQLSEIRSIVDSAFKQDYRVGCKDSNFASILQARCDVSKCPFYQRKEHVVELTEQEKKDALELLKDPKLLPHIDSAIHEKLVGETRNAFLTFFTIMSAKSSNPLNLRFSGRASVGKSKLVVSTARVFPKDMIILRGGFTKKSAYYELGKEIDNLTRVIDFSGKCLIILEEENSEEFLKEIRPLLSHDKDEIEYGFVEKIGDKNTTKKVVLKGQPSYIGITTKSEREEADETRALLVTPDVSKEKYSAVTDNDAKEFEEPWSINIDENRLKKIQNSIRIIPSEKVWIPYISVVKRNFRTNRPASMRDWKKLLSLLESITLFFQHQREKINIKNVDYVISSPLDYKIAHWVVENALMSTLTGIEEDIRKYFVYLKEKCSCKELTYRDLQNEYKKCFGEDIGKTTLRERYINKLVELGSLEMNDEKKPYKFSIASESLACLTISSVVVKEVESNKTKEFIKYKLCRRLPVDDSNKNLFEDAQKKIEATYNLSFVDDVERILKRELDKEYPQIYLKEESVDYVDISSKNNTEKSDNVNVPVSSNSDARINNFNDSMMHYRD